MNHNLIQIGLDSGMLNYVDNETPRHYFLSGHADEKDLEKFAELIIQECARLNKNQFYELMSVITEVKEHNGFDDACLNTVIQVAEYLAKDLKDHFGVE